MNATASRQSALAARPDPAVAEKAPSHERPEPEEQLQRDALIAEAAFFIALERGFAPGRELDDWLAAEHEVDQRRSATQN